MTVLTQRGGTLLGFSGNGCIDALNALNRRYLADGSPVRAVDCSTAILQEGTTITVNNGDGTTGTLTPTVSQLDPYQSFQGAATYNALMLMSPDEALVISMAVALLWAGAWGVRQIARTFLNPNERNEDE